MKKFLKILTILVLIIDAIVVSLILISHFKPDALAPFFIEVYEELTNEIGKSAAEVYEKLRRNALIAGFVLLWVNIILFVCNFVENRKTTEENKIETERSLAMRKARLTKEEKALRKAEKQAKKKLRVKDIEDTTALVDSAVNGMSQNVQTINSFIDSLKKRH